MIVLVARVVVLAFAAVFVQQPTTKVLLVRFVEATRDDDRTAAAARREDCRRLARQLRGDVHRHGAHEARATRWLTCDR